MKIVTGIAPIRSTAFIIKSSKRKPRLVVDLKLMEDSIMVNCDWCGKMISSDQLSRCPFCGNSSDNSYYPEVWRLCPTCSAPVRGLECTQCGEELSSSFYQYFNFDKLDK
jgi:endogenous inhibitor of DNA gyrase (YacG/DUF329 family)